MAYTYNDAALTAVTGAFNSDDFFGLDGTTAGPRKVQCSRFVLNDQSYANPAWITSLAAAKITGLAASATTDTTNAANISSGTLAAARLPAFTGDATSTAGTSALTLANSGVALGTYTKVTVDAKGRVTVGNTLTSADLPTYTGTLTSGQVTNALGYTPLSNATSYLPLSGGSVSYLGVNNGSAINLKGAGSGTYNTSWIYSDGTINSWEAPLTTDAVGGIKVPFYLTWRGGYATQGGLKLTGGAAAELGGNAILHAGNYNSYSPSLTGTGASGTWAISVTGTAANVTGTVAIANGGTGATTALAASDALANFGQLQGHSTYTDFNTVPSAWGFNFVQGNANAPHINSSQWYRARLSLGAGYGIGHATANNYWLEIAIPRYGISSYGNLYFRTNESGTVSGWTGARVAYADSVGSITSGQVTTALGYTPENSANKGVANGYASLDSGGKVPSTQLPSYVDDVLEYTNTAGFPATGETGKIYVALDTNKTYRWSGTAYIEISASPGSTDAVAEGSTNLYFTNARARAAISASGSLSYNSSTGVISFSDAVTSVFGRTGAVALTSSDVTTALGFTPYSATNPSGYITSSGSISGNAATATTANALNTGNNYQVNSIGIGIAASGTAGSIGLNQSGVRSWAVTPSGGNLAVTSGDSSGSVTFNGSALQTLTALNAWAGSANITTIGTLASGTVPVARVSGLAASATTDTTNAANISSGTLPSGRLSGTYSISISGSASQFSSESQVSYGREKWESVTVGGDANTYYPVVFSNGYEDWQLFIRKQVHDFASWDGTLTAEIEWHSSTWGGDAGYVELRRLYQNQANKFLADWAQSAGPNSFAIVWLRGGGRTYQWRTSRWVGAPTVYLTTTDLGNSNGSVASKTTLVTTGQHTALTSYNYNSYAPTLTGTGASGTWGISITGSAASITGTYGGTLTSSQVTTALGFTPYSSSNPSGYTSNTGTVTSVAGTGTVSGLTLTGTVTTSGSLTLGGTLSLTSANVTGGLGYTPLSNAGGTISGSLNVTGNITVSSSNTTGGGIILADDGDIVDLNDGWASMRFSYGVRIYSANKSGSAVISLGNNGTVTATQFTGSGAGLSTSTVPIASLVAGDYSNKITSGVYSINVTGSAGLVAWSNVSGRPTWMTAGNLIEELTNFNNSRPSGFYQGSNATNSPTANTWYNMINVRHSNGANDHGFQLSMSYYSNTLYHRHYQGGTGANDGSFSAWATVLSSVNYNSYAPTLTGTGASGTWGISITGSAASITGTYSGSLTSSQVTTALGYTPYNSTNPNGYTSNTGTVTSVGGTGTVSGLTLTGTVTTSGSLTLGGTLSLTSANVTGGLGYTPANKAGDTFTSKVTFSYNNSVTGSTAPGYSQSNIEVYTTSNNVPTIGFHRSGVSATALYEYDGELYVNAWITRAQTGKLLSSGNYNSYAPTLTGTGASGTWGISITGSSASCTGNAATVSDGVYASTTQTISGSKTFSGAAYFTNGYVEMRLGLLDWLNFKSASGTTVGTIMYANSRLVIATGAGATNGMSLGSGSGTVYIDATGAITGPSSITATQFNGSGAGLSSSTVPIAAHVAGDYSAKVTSGTYSINISGTAQSATTFQGIGLDRFLYGSNYRRSSTYANMDTSDTSSGFYFYNTPSGGPFGDWTHWINCIGADWNPNYGFQIAHAFHSDSFAVRRVTNGSWSSWRTILTNANWSSFITASLLGLGTGNNVTFNAVNDVYGSLRALPQNSQGGVYTLVAADTGRHISASSTITVPSGVFSAGQLVTVYNNTAGNIAVNVSGVTMYQAGTANSGNRTLAQRGIATILCVAANTFVISGTGLT